MVWERYLLPQYEHEVAEGERARGTVDAYRGAWNGHIAPAWGKVPVDQVRPLGIQQWLSGLGLSSAKMCMNVMRPLMDYAVRYEWVETNPMRERYVMPSNSTVRTRDKGIWTLDELRELWGRVSGEWFEGAFLLSAFGGLRTGEALGVRSEDVTTDEISGVPVALVSVNKQVGNDGKVTKRLKTRQSRRTAVIVGKAAERLAEIADGADGWVTGDGLGGTSGQMTLRKSWDGVACYNFRNLRNSWETWMRHEVRVPPYVIEPLMGHKDPSVTGTYYDRPRDKSLAEAVAECYQKRPYDKNW
jgi:integrase